jgi:phospholipase D3/4
MVAYKSSLRGKHVLDKENLDSARLGDDIFDSLQKAASERNVRLEAVENYPPKDRGDNEDVMALADSGLLDRRKVHVEGGVMHSKFLISDDSHFYLGSANFDWRSLNQKMELGVHVENCPCLADDLKIIYDTYRTSSDEAPALTSKFNPLLMRVGDVDTEVYLAASPRQLNGMKRDWDLDAIVDLIDSSKTRLDINVMDYVPMFVYDEPRKSWPLIDDAIRRAVFERGVQVRFITAALHFISESLHALKSLQIAGQTSSNGGRVQVKILNVPAITEAHRAFARERRTHRKFVLNDNTLLIGTSNWSGDYFSNTTGVAIVMRQKEPKQPLIDQARQLFERDWKSSYVSDLDEYMDRCYDRETKKDLCKAGRMAYQEA